MVWSVMTKILVDAAVHAIMDEHYFTGIIVHINYYNIQLLYEYMNFWDDALLMADFYTYVLSPENEFLDEFQ